MYSPYDPEPAGIVDRDGRPVALINKGKRLRVSGIVNTWRIDEEWWREEISRLYFLIELENQRRIVVFRDLVGGGWFRQNWV
ncbi:MAG: hypothetical protein ABSC19_15285 [Syntrophorhabdales bacterium]|jgi:hypothetical protein